jgi:hypothetical protein
VPHRKRGGGETGAVEGEDGDHDDYVDEGNQHAAATGPPEAAESGAPPRSPNWFLLFGVAERIADPTERERMLAIARKLTGAETRAAAEIMSVQCCWDCCGAHRRDVHGLLLHSAGCAAAERQEQSKRRAATTMIPLARVVNTPQRPSQGPYCLCVRRRSIRYNVLMYHTLV